MNILKDFEKFASERGYSKFQEALSHIAYLRTFKDDSLTPAKTKKAQASPYYWKFLTRLPCAGCGSKIGVSPRFFSDRGEPCTNEQDKATYNCIPVCSTCMQRLDVLFAIKIRFQDIIISLLVTYLRCVEGT